MKTPPPLSPVQLKQHGFTTLLVRAIPGGTLANLPSLEPRPFAYEADIQIQALIEVGNHLPADQKETMALVNGFSILYSAAREMLLNVTARSAYGPVSLPTLSFVSLVQEARKQKAENQNAAAPAVPA